MNSLETGIIENIDELTDIGMANLEGLIISDQILEVMRDLIF